MADYYGFNPPFIGGPQNVMSRQEDRQLIKNDILQLLLTVPGERVNRPNYGTPLRSFVFENNTVAGIDALRVDIREAILNFEPRVGIERLEITQDADAHTLKLLLIVFLHKDPKVRLTIERFIESPVDARQ